MCIGYWSSGTRLADSSKVAGEGIGAGDLPEYMVTAFAVAFLTALNALLASAAVHIIVLAPHLSVVVHGSCEILLRRRIIREGKPQNVVRQAPG